MFLLYLRYNREDRIDMKLTIVYIIGKRGKRNGII